MKIKHTIRDIFIMFISLFGITYVYRMRKAKNGPLIRILCFHNIDNAEWFHGVISMCNKKYNILTPKQFHQEDFEKNKINVLLTFDDGYQTWIDNCLPVLEKYNCKGLFFINSGLLDAADNQETVTDYMKNNLLISYKKPLTWSGAKKLLEMGHTVGGHTVSHPNLTQLNSSEVRKEILDDKHRIEEMLDITLVDFAYPFGTRVHINSNMVSIIKSFCYAYMYSAISKFYVDKTDLELKSYPRTLIDKKQSIIMINSWINGSYDIFIKIKEKICRD